MNYELIMNISKIDPKFTFSQGLHLTQEFVGVSFAIWLFLQ